MAEIWEVERAIHKGIIKGIVIDTDKFEGWVTARGEEEDVVLGRLFPYISQIHFRFGHKEDIEPFLGNGETKSVEVMKELARMGYQGRAVVEIGWPDRGSIEVLHKEGLEKVHQRIVKFLKTLYNGFGKVV